MFVFFFVERVSFLQSKDIIFDMWRVVSCVCLISSLLVFATAEQCVPNGKKTPKGVAPSCKGCQLKRTWKGCGITNDKGDDSETKGNSKCATYCKGAGDEQRAETVVKGQGDGKDPKQSLRKSKGPKQTSANLIKTLQTCAVDAMCDGTKAKWDPNLTCEKPSLEPKDCSEGKCLFKEDFGFFPKKWSSTCVQVAVPFPQVPILQIEAGLNLQQTTGGNCAVWTEGQECSLGVTGTFSLAITIGLPDGSGSLGSVYYNGEVDLATDNGIPCKSLVSNRWECGHFRLFYAYLVNLFGSGMFTDPKFSSAMFAQITRSKADLKAEKGRAEDDSDMAKFVEDSSTDTKTGQLQVKPQVHPLYRAGKIWNTIVRSFWMKEVAMKATSLGEVPRHPYFSNRKAVKAAAKKGIVLEKKFIHVYDTLPGLVDKSTMGYTYKQVDFYEKRETLLKKANKLLKGGNANEIEKEIPILVRKLQVLFTWYVRYMLDTSVLQYFAFNPYPWHDNVLGNRKSGFTDEEKTATLDGCSSLPVHVNGAIGNKRGTEAGFGAVSAGSTNNYLFRGRPRLFCTVAKEVSMVPANDWKNKKRTRFARKDCNVDLSACPDPKACKTCAPDKKRLMQCDRVMQTDPKKSCTGKETYDPNDTFYDEKTGEMTYHIPLPSANMFPSVTDAAVTAMKQFQTLRRKQTLAPAYAKQGMFDHAVAVWDTFAKTVEQDAKKGESSQILQDFDEAFGVLKINEAGKVCPGFTPMKDAKKFPCKLKDFQRIAFGKSFGVCNGYVQKITAAAADVEKKFAEMAGAVKYPEKIEWKTSHSIAGTFFGGSVGFCTPDFNKVQFSAPITISGVYNPTKDGYTKRKLFGGKKSFGVSALFHASPLVAIKAGFERDITGDSTKFQAGIMAYLPVHTSVGKIDFVKDGEANALTKDNVLFQSVFEGVQMILSSFMPVVRSQSPGTSKKELGEYVQDVWERLKNGKSGKELLKSAVLAAAGTAAKGAALEVLKKLSPVNSALTPYIFINVDTEIDYNDLKNKNFGGMKPTMVLSMINVAEMELKLGVATVKPMYGSGLEIDLGAVVNSMLQSTGKYMQLKQEGKQKEEAKDERSGRCKECGLQLEFLFDKAKETRQCSSEDNPDVREECEYVRFDLSEFLATNRNRKTLEYLTMTDLLKKGASSDEFVQDAVTSSKSACEYGPKWCPMALTCRWMGVSCFAPRSNGIGL